MRNLLGGSGVPDRAGNPLAEQIGSMKQPGDIACGNSWVARCRRVELENPSQNKLGLRTMAGPTAPDPGMPAPRTGIHHSEGQEIRFNSLRIHRRS
jgi:hypothetical protein